MKSPFPGMDPYLEQYWGDVHTRLAVYARDDLQNRLSMDLIACIEEHVAIESDNDEDFQSYDDEVTGKEFGDDAARRGESSVELGVAESIEISRKPEPMTQRSIRIIDLQSGNRIVTAIEFLSPANKIGAVGRAAYSKRRDGLLDGGASLVEIDLIREGSPNLAIGSKYIPTRYRGPYRICVVRAWRENMAQLYRVPLRKRLPLVSIPLRKKDKEVSLDLQALIDMVYENGRYYRRDYSKDAEPPLAAADAQWADAILRENGFRGKTWK